MPASSATTRRTFETTKRRMSSVERLGKVCRKPLNQQSEKIHSYDEEMSLEGMRGTFDRVLESGAFMAVQNMIVVGGKDVATAR